MCFCFRLYIYIYASSPLKYSLYQGIFTHEWKDFYSIYSRCRIQHHAFVQIGRAVQMTIDDIIASVIISEPIFSTELDTNEINVRIGDDN